MSEKLRNMAEEMIKDVTDERLVQNFFEYLYYAELGSFKALQDLLDFVQIDGIAEIFDKLDSQLFEKFVQTILELSENAPVEV